MDERLTAAVLSHGMSISKASSFAVLWATSAAELVHTGRTVKLQEGDLVLVDRLMPASFGEVPGWSACMIDLGSRRIADLLGNDRRFVGVPFDRAGSLVMIIRRLCDLLVDMSRLEDDDTLADNGLTDMMTNLVVRLVATSFDWRVSRQSAATLDRARQCIRTNFPDPDFNVSALAAQMGISARHLSTIFAEAGTTIGRDILLRRMEHASLLLTDSANGTRQILEIAHACGFSDQTQFGRSFKRHFGVAPRAFRRRLT